MATVVLSPGDRIKIQFAESDGEFEIRFTRSRIIIDVGEWHDTKGRKGIVYEEIFGHGISAKAAALMEEDAIREPTPGEPTKR